MTGCGGSDAGPSPKEVQLSQQADALMKWEFTPGGIEVRFKADPQLNYYDGNPHTLALCIYQLAAPDSFKDQSQTESGLLTLLSCERFDEANVASSKRVFVQPGEERIMALDRAEGAKFLAVAAGYYELAPKAATRLFAVPVEEREETEGWIFTETYVVRTPGKLFMNLLLGPKEIQRVGSL